jgi:hypothetical protein
LRWLRRHPTAVVIVGLAAVLWASLWLFYDYRSPVRQIVTGIGTVQFDNWSASDLNMKCIRLEPATGTPKTTADAATKVALKTYPGGYIRKVLLVSYGNPCTGVHSKLAWAVSFAWTPPGDNPLATGPKPRGIVLVDATTGTVITNQAENAPSYSPSPT